MSKALNVYLYDEFAGKLMQGKDGKLSFAYDNKYVEEDKQPISILLPLKLENYSHEDTAPFFSGILPDDIVRYNLAKYLGVSDKNSFALLKKIGGECAGALTLLPEGEIISVNKEEEKEEVLEGKKLEEILSLLKRRPLLAGTGGIRLSLAGAQDKLAVGMKNNKIILTKVNPTTHILKPPIQGIEDSVHNEFFCMSLAKEIGIKVPNVEIRHCGNTSFYLVERYDRVINASGNVQRIHQEDFCQALGVLPELKYQREGGPNIQDCQTLINNHFRRPAIDQREFLKIIIFNYIIGNSDSHGKNFSILYTFKKPELAPAYDLLSTNIYQNVSSKMAMKIGSKYKYEEVFLRHWESLVPSTKIASDSLKNQLAKISDLCLEKSILLKERLKKKDIKSPVFDKILNIIVKNSNKIKGSVGK